MCREKYTLVFASAAHYVRREMRMNENGVLFIRGPRKNKVFVGVIRGPRCERSEQWGN